MNNVSMNVWGAEFDYAPTGCVSSLTVELVLQGLEERKHAQYDKNNSLQYTDNWNELVLPLQVSNRFVAVAAVRRAKKGLKGRVKLLSVDALLFPRKNTLKLGNGTSAAEVRFLLPYGFVWDAEGLFFNSDCLDTPTDREVSESLLRDLIVATNAGTVSP